MTTKDARSSRNANSSTAADAAGTAAGKPTGAAGGIAKRAALASEAPRRAVRRRTACARATASPGDSGHRHLPGGPPTKQQKVRNAERSRAETEPKHGETRTKHGTKHGRNTDEAVTKHVSSSGRFSTTFTGPITCRAQDVSVPHLFETISNQLQTPKPAPIDTDRQHGAKPYRSRTETVHRKTVHPPLVKANKPPIPNNLGPRRIYGSQRPTAHRRGIRGPLCLMAPK
jgi:hypothetical protein